MYPGRAGFASMDRCWGGERAAHLHDQGLDMDSLGGAHAVGPGGDLGLQAGICQRLHQEHPAHKAEV